MNAAVALDVGELLAAYDRSLRGPDSAHPLFGTVVERIGPLTLTHYGTHCIVGHPALDASTSAAQLVRKCSSARPRVWNLWSGACSPTTHKRRS